jgi:hypothetical protein
MSVTDICALVSAAIDAIKMIEVLTGGVSDRLRCPHKFRLCRLDTMTSSLRAHPEHPNDLPHNARLVG